MKPTKPSRRSKPQPKRCLDDPFAVTTSGVVLLNVQNFDGVETTEDAVRRAVAERASIFIGIAMNTGEVRIVLDHLRDVVQEPAWFVVGRRQRRTR